MDQILRKCRVAMFEIGPRVFSLVTIHGRRSVDDLQLAGSDAHRQGREVALRVMPEAEEWGVVRLIVRVPDLGGHHGRRFGSHGFGRHGRRRLLRMLDVASRRRRLARCLWIVDPRRADGVRKDDAGRVRPDGASGALPSVVQLVQDVWRRVARQHARANALGLGSGLGLGSSL
eukprot:scaffold13154_cov70-Phaeocystis_antarctica.AAC.1